VRAAQLGINSVRTESYMDHVRAIPVHRARSLAHSGRKSNAQSASAAQKQHRRRQLRTAVVVPKSVGSAACLRCCPIGDRGVLSVGMLFVVKRRCSWPRASLAEDGPIWLPTARRGLVREAKDGSSRGDRRPLRSPIPAEKAIFY
jgi:hypothetical protein